MPSFLFSREVQGKNCPNGGSSCIMEAIRWGGEQVELNIDEALRYLGVREAADGPLHKRAALLAGALQSRITPRSIWRAFPLDGGALLPDSRLAQRMLADCRQAAVMVCTLGADFDGWMRQLQHRSMPDAVLLDALGSVYVEAACDAVEEAIRSRFPGMYLTDRFSPGYGDFPLTAQAPLMALAGAHRIGVTLTDSMLMNPQKSVTAVVGVADRPQMARIRGCTYCAMNQTCNLRKAGTPCYV